MRSWQSLAVATVMLVGFCVAGCGDRSGNQALPKNSSPEKNAASAPDPAPEDMPAAGEDEQGVVRAAGTIWVVEPRGSRQCEGGGLSVEQSRGKLVGNGVKVIESRCGVRADRMYPSVCGGPTGDILLHRIPSDLLDAALELGFDPVSNIPYRFSSCTQAGGEQGQGGVGSGS
ncbi:hypothetical protein PVT68_17845 [Microbulbifer bruguierae]|uniref:Lipoprotein n=1 Tax=Microbulbifer bruguierae TaxID=3029061 RepID=A0ABY8NDU3_9GAMM|nr:hypothetical protein [Microbulbifer bruguierae]WGL16609.1 hypothetical protein PVT68_17845 [Microbulbifer bruguierae]